MMHMSQFAPEPHPARMKKNIVQQKQKVFLSDPINGDFSLMQKQITDIVGADAASKLSFQQRGFLFNGATDLLVFYSYLSQKNLDALKGDVYSLERPELTIISDNFLRLFGIPISVRFDGTFTEEQISAMKFSLHQMGLRYSTVLFFPQTMEQPCDYVISDSASPSIRNEFEVVTSLANMEQRLLAM